MILLIGAFVFLLGIVLCVSDGLSVLKDIRRSLHRIERDLEKLANPLIEDKYDGKIQRDGEIQFEMPEMEFCEPGCSIFGRVKKEEDDLWPTQKATDDFFRRVFDE